MPPSNSNPESGSGNPGSPPPAADPSAETTTQALGEGNHACETDPSSSAAGGVANVVDPGGPTDFPIVGIGASSAGLEALQQFFAKIPGDCGLAFVVVVHLSPDHDSVMAELLQKDVAMPVQQVRETVTLEKNHVYVIPPNANLEAIDTRLQLSELPDKAADRSPIDHFFRTLARNHDLMAFGVVLTGTGDDGALGLREIRRMGGVTIVQDPDDATFGSMPRNALRTGSPDLLLPLDEIPGAVLRLSRVRPCLPDAELEDAGGRLIERILVQVRSRTGQDFTRYKHATIRRRIERRMQIRFIEAPREYLQLLRGDQEEVVKLADDLLVTVTSFFRDPDIFKRVENEVIPQLLKGKTGDDEVRIWSVGCATGEEA